MTSINVIKENTDVIDLRLYNDGGEYKLQSNE